MIAGFPDRVWVNDRSLREFNLLVDRVTGFLSAASVGHQLVPIPGRTGHLRVGLEGESGPRRFTVEGLIRAATVSEVELVWGQAIQALKDDELEVRIAERPDWVGYAQLESADWREAPGHTRAAKFSLGFVMSDPLKYSRQVDVYTIADGAEVPLLLGSASSDVHLYFISNGLGNPRVVYKDAQGFTRGDLTFAVTALEFPVGRWIDFNWDGFQLARLYTSAPPNVSSTRLAPVITKSFVANPRDGDGVQGPTLQAVNCRLVAHIQKAWE